MPAVHEETPRTFNEIAKERKVNHSTVHRWARQGVLVRGRLVKLEAVRVGGKYRTSAEALARFDAACNAGPEPTGILDRTPAQAHRDSERAGKRVKQLFKLK